MRALIRRSRHEGFPFLDVREGHWYRVCIFRGWDCGILSGVSRRFFQPFRTATRAMLVTALWRLEGRPIVNGVLPADTDPGAWYADAACWAAERGIVRLRGGKFFPGRRLSREQAAEILFRYAGKWSDRRGDLRVFRDRDAVNPGCRAAVSWCAGVWLLCGSGGHGMFRPKVPLSRAEMALVLDRLRCWREERAARGM